MRVEFRAARALKSRRSQNRPRRNSQLHGVFGGKNPQICEPWIDYLKQFPEETTAHVEIRGVPGSVTLGSIVDPVLFPAKNPSLHRTEIDFCVAGGAAARLSRALSNR